MVIKKSGLGRMATSVGSGSVLRTALDLRINCTASAVLRRTNTRIAHHQPLGWGLFRTATAPATAPASLVGVPLREHASRSVRRSGEPSCSWWEQLDRAEERGRAEPEQRYSIMTGSARIDFSLLVAMY